MATGLLARLLQGGQPGLAGMLAPAPGLMSDPLAARGNPQAQAFMAQNRPQTVTGAHSFAPAPQGQPMPQGAPAASPAAPAAGNGGGGLGGLLSNLFNPGASQRNATVEWLMRDGLDEGTATFMASDREAMRNYIANRGQRSKPIEINGRLVDPNTYQVLADFSDKGSDNEFLERQAAAQQFGLQEGSPEYQRFILTGDIPSNREQDPGFKNEMDLRKEYDALPEVKDYKIVRSNFERIRQGVQLGTGAGDAAIVFGYMKMLDPTSVVREGEQATTRNAAGVPEAIRGMYNQLIGGGQLSGEARNQILAAAEKVYAESSANIEDVNQRYSDFATMWQLDPSRIVAPVEQYDPLNLAPPAAPAAPAAPPAPPAAPVAPSGDGWREMKPGVRIRRVQ